MDECYNAQNVKSFSFIMQYTESNASRVAYPVRAR